jgi:hypothetical protein
MNVCDFFAHGAIIGSRPMVRRAMRILSSRQPSTALRARSRWRASIRRRRDACDSFARLRWRGRSESPRRLVETGSAPTHLRWSEGKVALPSPLFLATNVGGDYYFITTSNSYQSHSSAIDGSIQAERLTHHWRVLCGVGIQNSLLCRRRLANAL